MTYEDVVEERANYRVRLELDDSAEKPEDDGACPILQVKTGWSSEFNAFNDHADGFEGTYRQFYEALGSGALGAFERYLRIFHGCRSFVEGESESYSYIAFDTAAWREKVGLTDEWLLADPMNIPNTAKGSLEEVVAWADGEVYGYIVEKNVAAEDEEPEWADVDDGTCWSFYGREWAEEAAKAELELAVKYNH